MITVQKDDLQYLTSPLLEAVPHCFSTRFGGVSEGYLGSLNLGTHRGDRPENVRENYRILGEAVGFKPENTVFTKQIHSDIVERVGLAHRGRGLLWEATEGCDGLVTNEPGVVLTVFSADCTPILFYDPVAGAVGACHAGWRGTAAGIAARVVERMRLEFGSEPKHIRAAIGPCISQCCFETREDVPNAMLRSLGEDARSCILPKGEKFLVDLKGLNVLWLRRAGVEQISVAAECTACEPDRFWSHRRVGDRRGSLAALITLGGGAL